MARPRSGADAIVRSHTHNVADSRNNHPKGTTSALPRRPETASVRLKLRRDLTPSWLIFGEWNLGNYKACAAASTSSAWPSTFTLRQILAILPFRLIRTVVRR